MKNVINFKLFEASRKYKKKLNETDKEITDAEMMDLIADSKLLELIDSNILNVFNKIEINQINNAYDGLTELIVEKFKRVTDQYVWDELVKLRVDKIEKDPSLNRVIRYKEWGKGKLREFS